MRAFTWCLKRQTTDDDDYRQRPKTHHSLEQGAAKIISALPTGISQRKGPPKSMKEMEIECLQAHNEFREKHGVPAMTLSSEICAYATEWARQLAKSNILHHRKNNKYGENLYLGCGVDNQAHVVAVQSWYNEIKDYNFNKPGFSPMNGHFTQVIWKASTELGVGVVSSNDRTWVVCNYNPPGNVMGNYMRNVPPLIEQTVTKIIDKMKSQKTVKAIPKEPDTVHPSSSIDSIFSLFAVQCLNCHNHYRSIHKSPPLKLNKDLCKLAQDWSLHLAKQGKIVHRRKIKTGENIYFAQNFVPTAEQCVKSWYDEIQNYDFSSPGFNQQTGHFTQVVWKCSTELGVGISMYQGITFVVCNYLPPGNIRGQYEIQVLPPGDKQSISSRIAVPKPSFEEICLQSHNDMREKHGSPPLVLNKNLSFLADSWAKVRTTEINHHIRTTTTRTINITNE